MILSQNRVESSIERGLPEYKFFTFLLEPKRKAFPNQRLYEQFTKAPTNFWEAKDIFGDTVLGESMQRFSKVQYYPEALKIISNKIKYKKTLDCDLDTFLGRSNKVIHARITDLNSKKLKNNKNNDDYKSHAAVIKLWENISSAIQQRIDQLKAAANKPKAELPPANPNVWGEKTLGAGTPTTSTTNAQGANSQNQKNKKKI